MVTETDIRAKADEELLGMWTEQYGYIPEVVGWVKAEIERRQLNTSGIHVRTADEMKEEEERESDRNFVRMVSYMQGACGVFLLALGVPVILEELTAYYRYQTELDIASNLVILLIALLLTIYAIGVWRENRWAIISGLILYLIASISNIIAAIIYGLAFLRGGGTLVYFGGAVALTFISISLVFAFNRIRKSRLARGGLGTEKLSISAV